MRSSNPVLTGRGFARINPDVLNRPAQTGEAVNAYESRPASAPVTMDDVVIKTAGLFAVLVAVGAFAWKSDLGGTAMLIGLLGGFALGLVNSFSRKVRPALVIAYAAFEGLALGGISKAYEAQYPGIINQAVLATICAFGGVLFAYSRKKIRVTPKFTRILMAATLGYLVVGIISMFTSLGGSPIVAVVGVALATFFIILDFDQIERAIAARLPQEESWRLAFGLMVTLVWLYLEVLRLISSLRERN